MCLHGRFPDILIRWRIYIEECGLRGVYKPIQSFSLMEFRREGRIDVDSFLNLADLIWGAVFLLFSCDSPIRIVNALCLDIERTYEPHTFVQVAWIENWFLAQVFASHITDFGLETRHFKTGVAKDNPAPVVPDTVLAKLATMFEAKLRRKKEVKLIPLVPRKPSAEVIKNSSTNKLKRRPSALVLLHSNLSQPQPSSSRSRTPTSQNSDAQNQHQQNKLRKRSRSSTRPSPELVQQSLPVQTPVTPPLPAQAQAITVKDRDRDKVSEAAFYLSAARTNLGPPPSPSNGKRFEGVGVSGRRTPEKLITRSSQLGPPSPSLVRAKQSVQGWEII